MKAKIRRLPNGKTTTSLRSYVRAWNQLGRRITKKTGWELMAYDPGFLFDMGDGRTLTLPADAVLALTKEK